MEVIKVNDIEEKNPIVDGDVVDIKDFEKEADKNHSKIHLQLKWNITLKAMIKKDDNSDSKDLVEKKLLDGVKGDVITGETLAILGASGAGKTTLLNYLSMRINNSSLISEGETTLNNNKMKNEDFNAISSYVMQDDVLEPDMTPREILLFTGKMKLDLSTHDIEQRVAYLIKKLRLERCQHTPIGNNLKRGVSGGERKRTSIAVELLSDSPIIFLDEPTTGLDSFNAYEVVNTLNELSDMNKIVIFTIHQPASEIFPLLNKICVLALGKTVYFGPSANIYKYFEHVRLPIKENYNPFEHLIEVTNLSCVEENLVSSAYPELESLPDKYKKYSSLISTLNEEYIKNFEVSSKNIYSEIDEETKLIINQKKHNISYLYETYLLCLRLMIRKVRNKNGLIGRIGSSIFIGIIMTLLFNQIGRDEISIRDRIGFLAMVSLNCIFMSVTASITTCKLLNYNSLR